MNCEGSALEKGKVGNLNRHCMNCEGSALEKGKVGNLNRH